MKNFYQKACPQSLKHSFCRRGITVMEFMVLFAVLAIIVAIVISQFSQTRELQVLKTAVGDTLSALDKARAETLSYLDSSEYGVGFKSDRIIIFKGKVFSSGATDNETIDIVSPAGISNVTLGGASGSSGDMYFSRLSGMPSKSGTVTILTTSYSRTITISATGMANSN